MKKLLIDSNACKGCGYCIKFCPKNALSFSGQMNRQSYVPVTVNDELCVFCGTCYTVCPDMVFTGEPLDPLKMAALESAPAFVARGALNSPKNIIQAKKYIKKAALLQMIHKKYSIVELLSPCPTDWNMKPVDAISWIDNEVTRYYPLGVFKDFVQEGEV